MKTLPLVLTALLAQSAAHALQPLRMQDFDVNPPPRAGSREEARDFHILHNFQKTRTARECARGEIYNHGPGVFSFRNFFGDLLSPEELSAAGPAMQEAFTASNTLANSYKRRYTRAYPFEHPGFRSCVGDGKGDGSYPSGHATVSSASACLLAEIYPRKAEKILERGEFHGDIRVVIGRHFPSDVEEGKRLGKQICQHLLRDPEFKSQLESLR